MAQTGGFEHDDKKMASSGLDDQIDHVSIRGEALDSEKQMRSNEHAAFKGKEDPFAYEEGAEVQYRTMTWWQCGILMIAESISLGILSLPSSMATLGFVPCCIMIIGIGFLTTYTGYVLCQFKLLYPHVHSLADAAEVMGGAWAREVVGAAQLIFYVFIMGTHILTFSIMMNTLTDHGACTIVFTFVGTVICFLLNLPRTLRNVSYLAICSTLSILSAVIVTMAAVGADPPKNVHILAAVDTTLIAGFSATLNIIISLAGHVAFLSFQSELADPREYPKSLYMLQFTDTSLYLIVAVVIYRYAGEEVKSPAFLSASPVVAKVAFGLAIGTIVIAGVILGHVGAKYLYVRVFRGTNRMNERTLMSYGSWVLISFVLWIVAWIIAEAIPVFNDMLNLLAAAFASWFSFGLEGMLWLHMNRGKYFSTPVKCFLTILNIGIIIFCLVTCGMGLWVTGTGIAESAKHAHGSFSCANNA